MLNYAGLVDVSFPPNPLETTKTRRQVSARGRIFREYPRLDLDLTGRIDWVWGMQHSILTAYWIDAAVIESLLLLS